MLSSAVIMKIFIVAVVALLILSVVDTSQSYALEREDVDDLDCVHDEGILKCLKCIKSNCYDQCKTSCKSPKSFGCIKCLFSNCRKCVCECFCGQ